MTPEELIEDMARAMRTRLTVNVLRHAPQVGHGWLNELSVAMAADALAVVREAMREPSEEMLLAGSRAAMCYGTPLTRTENAFKATLSHSPLADPKP